jgi:hypothetical protein
LVAVATRELGQAWAIGLDQTHTGFGGTLDELTHTRITARGVKVNFNDGLRRCFNAHANGVKAEENFWS